MPDFVRHKTGEQNAALPSRVEWHPYSSSETPPPKRIAACAIRFCGRAVRRRTRNNSGRDWSPQKTREMLDGWRLREGDGLAAGGGERHFDFASAADSCARAN